MTLDQAMKKIRDAEPDQVVEVAETCVSALSQQDRDMAGEDLMNTAILRSLMEAKAGG